MVIPLLWGDLRNPRHAVSYLRIWPIAPASIAGRDGYATSFVDAAKLRRPFASFRFPLRNNGSEIGKSPR
jgi:hypothetical protein